MPGKTQRIYILALLLAGMFLIAQFHCCVSLTSSSMDSHACPICSTAGIAVATPSLLLALIPAINRLEAPPMIAVVSVVVLRNVEPRAPPAS
jgi:hypothetical protein